MYNYSAILTLILGLCLFACESESKEPDKPVDVRDQAVGNYKGKSTLTLIAVAGRDVLSDVKNSNETFTVTANSSNNNSINIESNGSIIKGTKVAQASNGFSFDLEEQTITDNTGQITFKGSDGIDLGGTKYDGAYFSSTKTIEFGYVYSAKIRDIPVIGTFTVKATKQ